MQGHKQTTKQR